MEDYSRGSTNMQEYFNFNAKRDFEDNCIKAEQEELNKYTLRPIPHFSGYDVELKKQNIEDNPFDLMFIRSVDLMKSLLHFGSDINTLMRREQLDELRKKLSETMGVLNEEIDKLDNLSNESMMMCASTSVYYKKEKSIKDIDSTLDTIDKMIQTKFNKGSNPYRNYLFERLRLGENSEEWKRRSELANIFDKTDADLTDISYLKRLRAVLLYPEENSRDYDFEEKKKIIKKFKLTESDIEFLIQYMSNIANFISE